MLLRCWLLSWLLAVAAQQLWVVGVTYALVAWLVVSCGCSAAERCRTRWLLGWLLAVAALLLYVVSII